MESEKYSALACLKETQGERVMRALMKIYNRMCDLEKTKERRQNRVKSLNGHTDHPSSDEFHRRLANVEAQCILLEEQLVCMRNIIRGLSSDQAEEEFLDQIPTKLPCGYDMSEAPGKNSFDDTIQGYFQSDRSLVNYPVAKEKKEAFGKQLQYDSPSFMTNFQSDYNQNQFGSKIGSRKYHVNVNSMPFVSATTSSSKSHSLRANIQTVYSMAKYHNPAMCQAAPLHRKRSLSAERRPSLDKVPQRRRSNSVSDISRPHEDCKPRQTRLKCSHPESEFEIDLTYSRGKSSMSEAQKRKIFLRDLKSVNFHMNKGT